MNWKILLLSLVLVPSLPGQDAKAELAKRYPSLRVQGKVGTKRDQQGSSYMQTMTISPEVVIESATTQPMGAAEATFLIVTMDTAKKYRDRVEEYKVASNETVAIPAVPKGIRRTFDFANIKTRFDSWRDGSNVGGEVYKYYVMAVRADTKEILHFETNCAPLQKQVQGNTDLQERLLKLAKNAKFPVNIQ
jgi:hypothetical protein